MIICRFCSYSPCMCGRSDYGTPEANRHKDSKEVEQYDEGDEWADPGYRGDEGVDYGRG